jgi:methylglutamate dehydrogenase subunit C
MSTQPMRVAKGGLIDRTRLLRFRFDGRAFEGHPGDTLASALLAHGVRLLGRSFKYHRPRGIVAAGVDEPNALVELGTGARLEPNTLATQVELYDGLVASSQNRWPSLRFDLMALNSLLAPILPAGFYYKTFMWPASFWEPVYERLIRRSAGLGRAARAPDPDAYEHGHLHCDVLVVGAGPAGLAAALAAGASGARVLLADERPHLGGTLAFERRTVGDEEAADWIGSTARSLAALSEVRILRRTCVFGYYDHNVLGALERVADPSFAGAEHAPRQRFWTIRARQVVLATGALERPLVFADNDRPGIMLASAVRAYLNGYGVVPGRRIVVATNNDDAYRTALDAHAVGIEVAAVVDCRADSGPLADRARCAGIPVRAGTVVSRACGGREVRAVELATLDGTALGRLECDLVAMSGGWNPTLHLSSQSGARPGWSEALATFVPGVPCQAERSAGAARGVFDLAGCLADGLRAGAEAAAAGGFPAADLPPPPPAEDELPEAALQPLWWVRGGRGKAFVDFQNDVTAADLRLAVREGYVAAEHAKRYTTLGMATDQGKIANVNGLAILAEARGDPIPEVGVTTFRPPYAPVAIGSFAGHARGRHYQPVRRTAIHPGHERHGAVFVEAGHWLRPQYYPAGAEDVATATAREALAVRRAVGLCDVSTLGKIDLQGPDTAAFMDRLYVNMFSTLPVGRARYGLMLREDGIVFDDGTTSRLGEQHFLMTTTTANAAAVLAHMEFYAQTVWPELDLRFCSVTEQWAGIALSGPRAREVLARVVDGLDVSNEALPYMGVAATTIGGVPARIFRISFSGELAYEINVPAGYGEAVWELLMGAGAPFEIVPYGMEALGVLRIEKGHVAGPELDGRTTARDLGLGRMLSARKAFVGQKLMVRPGLADPQRPALVGLKPVEPGARLRGGAHLVEDPQRASGEDSLGHVTSVANSPTRGHWIALALVAGGPERLGQRLYAVYPLKDETVAVDVVHPVFVDPEGARVRA